MRPTDKATADSRSLQSFAIIKNTGNGNFVLGRFHTRARNGLFAGLRLACVQSNPPRQTPLVRFFLRGGDGCTEARHIGLCKADRTTWKLTLQDNNTTPKEPKTERVVAVDSCLNVNFVHRLSETDDPSSNCPSKLTDKVRRIVHSK